MESQRAKVKPTKVIVSTLIAWYRKLHPPNTER